jgi:hypothetical protein
MSEQGVTVINGGGDSRASSPEKKPEEEKKKKFQNGWSRELERLMADWSDIAICYRWLHDNSSKIFHTKTLAISLPVIFLSTLSGFSNIGVQAILESETAKKYASFVIAGISLIAGMLTTVGDRLRYAQLEESHRVAAISWGKFQRLIAVELALNPDERMDSLDFLKICRGELDRLIEQSPPIPKESITTFGNKFGTIKDLKKPDICGALEHTGVFESSETRLKHAAVEAALMLRRRKQALAELVTPQIEGRIKGEIESRLADAIELRKDRLEKEIEQKRQEAKRVQEEYEEALNERKKRIQEEIDTEKKKLYQESAQGVATAIAKGGSQFESRLNFRRASILTKGESSRKLVHMRSNSPPLKRDAIYKMEEGEQKNTVVVPQDLDDNPGEKIIIISKE